MRMHNTQKEKIEILKEVVNRNKLKNTGDSMDKIVDFLNSVDIKAGYKYKA